jgi:hypothetical protein
MSTRLVRAGLLATSVGGIVGMIVTSIADSPSGALAFGLATGAGAFGLMLITTVGAGGGSADVEVLGQVVDQRMVDLVADGADEREVRALVRDAVKLGRAARPES